MPGDLARCAPRSSLSWDARQQHRTGELKVVGPAIQRMAAIVLLPVNEASGPGVFFCGVRPKVRRWLLSLQYEGSSELLNVWHEGLVARMHLHMSLQCLASYLVSSIVAYLRTLDRVLARR